MSDSARAMVRAAWNVTTLDGTYMLRGTAGEDCPTGAPFGGRLKRLVSLNDVTATVTRWEAMGRTVTAVNVVNYGVEIDPFTCTANRPR